MTLDDAIALAVSVHRGQLDQAGEPYILHPLRVMLAMTTEEARIVGVLHDVIENADDRTPSGGALIAGFQPGQAISDALLAMTRLRGEFYPDHIERVAANPLATTVKLADLRDNLDPVRLARLPERTRERQQKKYSTARARLSGLRISLT